MRHAIRISSLADSGSAWVWLERSRPIRPFGPRVVVGADLAPGAVAGDERAKILNLPEMKNLPPSVHYEAAGQAKWQAEMMINFMIALIAGVLLVFAVLVLLYRRAIPPMVNMASLLLAPLGGGIALHLLDALQDPAFMRTFTSKGRFKDLMARVPIHVITARAALVGAAATYPGAVFGEEQKERRGKIGRLA